MGSYALVFTITYLVATLLANAVMAAVKYDGSFSANVASVVLASFIAAWRFTKQERRIPEPAEKAQFSKMALAGLWLSSLVLVAIYVGALLPATEARRVLGLISSTRALLLGLGFAVVMSLVYYFVIKWAFSWYANRSHRA